MTCISRCYRNLFAMTVNKTSEKSLKFQIAGLLNKLLYFPPYLYSVQYKYENDAKDKKRMIKKQIYKLPHQSGQCK